MFKPKSVSDNLIYYLCLSWKRDLSTFGDNLICALETNTVSIIETFSYSSFLDICCQDGMNKQK